MGFEVEEKPGQTLISEEEKAGLRLPISTQQELDEVEQVNIEKALVWLIGRAFSPTAVLNETFLRKLHKLMFNGVWKWAGTFRKTEKNIGVSWVQVSRELRMLCDDALFWIENETFPPEEIALRFKHKLVSIHCFPNGNGRHSRMMADVLMENVFDLAPFTWGANLVNATGERKLYIEALKKADDGEMGELLAFAK
ncbi:MAG: Fic-DOC domain mobile mystery protein B [Neolewinella sp.]|jgi:Fic-DOC domain mobile mystery protein B